MRLKLWRRFTVVTGGAGAGPDPREQDMAGLYDCEAPRLRRGLARVVGPDQAADLVQSAFVRMLRLESDRATQLEHPRAYLHSVTRNLARDHARATARRLPGQHDDIDDCQIAGPDPHDALEARDQLRRIETALSSLPERTRAIFSAHRFEDLTYLEIAERMGISIKTVEKHISLALRALHRSVGTAR